MKNTLIFLFLICANFTFLNAQNKGANNNVANDRVAIQGYDPIAYFKSNKAIKGNKSIKLEHKNALYYFLNEENKATFMAMPEKYTPQYGGWCAYAMGETGEKVAINPATFKILEGKLYLFYNAYFTNTLPLWNKKEAVLKTQGDKNWAKLFN